MVKELAKLTSPGEEEADEAMSRNLTAAVSAESPLLRQEQRPPCWAPDVRRRQSAAGIGKIL